MALSTSNTAAARLFDEIFHPQARSLANELSTIPSLPTAQEKSKSLNAVLEGIADLQRSVQDASSYSNNHDQAVYAASLKKLQASADSVRNAITPKSRFKFRAARQVAPDVAPGTDGKDADVATDAGSVANGSEAAHAISQYAAPTESLLRNEGSGILREQITVSAERLTEVSTKLIRNVTESMVDLATNQQEPSASLSLNDISKSILYCGNIEGSLHMTFINSSLIFARAHQLRIHDCDNVTLYLDVGSQPVIERCSGMMFAPLGEMARDGWEQVLDFQYPGGDSPNWSPISSEARIKGLKIQDRRAIPDTATQPLSREEFVARLKEGLVETPIDAFSNLTQRTI